MTDTNNSAFIKIVDISFSYGSSTKALKSISLDINHGEQIALVGQNGSGKSTLAKHLNGLLKPSSGIVLINGQSTEIQRTAQLAGTVGLLFQNPDDQICKRTVRAEVAFGPLNLGYPSTRIDELTHNALESFGLLQQEELNPHDLGYSERKRLALASVVAMDTQVLILDEPTAGLDPQEVEMLESVMVQLNKEDKTVIVISHDMDFIAENTTRAICLKEGKKIFDGSCIDFFLEQDLIKKGGLLCPQIARLSSHYNLRPHKLSPENFIAELESRKTTEAAS